MSEILIGIVCVMLAAAWTGTLYIKEAQFMKERRAWYEERADLLNRIQAGNYAEYKTQEIRLVKAQQGEEKKPNTLEQL